MERAKTKEVENTSFKLWNSGTMANKNGVDILIDKNPQGWSGGCQKAGR
jgi:hypothetical protein